eukprot:4888564-Amphidinium_carterae.1
MKLADPVVALSPRCVEKGVQGGPATKISHATSAMTLQGRLCQRQYASSDLQSAMCLKWCFEVEFALRNAIEAGLQSTLTNSSNGMPISLGHGPSSPHPTLRCTLLPLQNHRLALRCDVHSTSSHGMDTYGIPVIQHYKQT